MFQFLKKCLLWLFVIVVSQVPAMLLFLRIQKSSEPFFVTRRNESRARLSRESKKFDEQTIKTAMTQALELYKGYEEENERDIGFRNHSWSRSPSERIAFVQEDVAMSDEEVVAYPRRTHVTSAEEEFEESDELIDSQSKDDKRGSGIADAKTDSESVQLTIDVIKEELKSLLNASEPTDADPIDANKREASLHAVVERLSMALVSRHARRSDRNARTIDDTLSNIEESQRVLNYAYEFALKDNSLDLLMLNRRKVNRTSGEESEDESRDEIEEQISAKEEAQRKTEASYQSSKNEAKKFTKGTTEYEVLIPHLRKMFVLGSAVQKRQSEIDEEFTKLRASRAAARVFRGQGTVIETTETPGPVRRRGRTGVGERNTRRTLGE